MNSTNYKEKLLDQKQERSLIKSIQNRCLECAKIYKVVLSRKDKTKYCSRKCANTGIARRPVTWGHKIGLKNKGKKRPDLAEYNKSHKKKGEQNYLWKGDEVGYSALHVWIKREYGKPQICEHCESKKNLQWANISGKYHRKRSDWKTLCAKCHYQFDIVIQKLAAIKRRKQ